jgi:carboxypeptidase PM20D1
MIVLYCLFALIAVLATTLLLNTAIKTAKAHKLEGDHPTFSQEELEEYATALQQMIACKTVSVKDSYDDTEFAKLRQVVRERFPLLHEKAELKICAADCWVYKIPGKDQRRNILLMSHHDVVDADEQWTYEPFSGTVVDGKIYGRGAADTKGSLCAILFAAEQLLREGFQPEVNVYLLSSHNEELGGDGITSARSYFQEQGITFEVVLDEGGAIIDPPLGNMQCEKCAMVAVHEKGRCRVRFTATWESSHVSLTGYKNNPVERMATFIQDVTAKDIFIRRFNPQVEGMFAQLAPYCGFPMNVLLSNLWLFGGIIKKVLPKINATAGGMIGTTCNFQKIEGGTNEKIVTASAMLRHVDEHDLDKDLQTLKTYADKYGIAMEISHREYYTPADTSLPAYSYALDCLKAVFPKFPAAPYILPAGTDAWKLTPVCDCVLRFTPTRMSSKQLASIHAVDENLDVAAIAEAAVFYKHFVKHYM